MYSSAYVWAKVLSHMEEKLGSIPVSSWFDDAEVVELNENNLIIYSPFRLPPGHHPPPVYRICGRCTKGSVQFRCQAPGVRR